MNNLDKYPNWMSIKDVAEALDISKPFVRQLCLTKKIKHIRIGWLYKIEKADLVEFLQERKKEEG
jgi:excisionase family DNA binding protein